MSSRRPQEGQNELQKAPRGPKSSDGSIFSDGKAKSRARAHISEIFLLLARVLAFQSIYLGGDRLHAGGPFPCILQVENEKCAFSSKKQGTGGRGAGPVGGI